MNTDTLKTKENKIKEPIEAYYAIEQFWKNLKEDISDDSANYAEFNMYTGRYGIVVMDMTGLCPLCVNELLRKCLVPEHVLEGIAKFDQKPEELFWTRLGKKSDLGVRNSIVIFPTGSSSNAIEWFDLSDEVNKVIDSFLPTDEGKSSIGEDLEPVAEPTGLPEGAEQYLVTNSFPDDVCDLFFPLRVRGQEYDDIGLIHDFKDNRKWCVLALNTPTNIYAISPTNITFDEAYGIFCDVTLKQGSMFTSYIGIGYWDYPPCMVMVRKVGSMEPVRERDSSLESLEEQLLKNNIQRLSAELGKRGVDVSSFWNISTKTDHLKDATKEQNDAYSKARMELANITTKTKVDGYFRGEPDSDNLHPSYIIWGISKEQAFSLGLRLLQEDILHTHISDKDSRLEIMRYKNAQDHGFASFDSDTETGHMVMIAATPDREFKKRGCTKLSDSFFYSCDLYKEYDTAKDTETLRRLSLNEDIDAEEITSSPDVAYIMDVGLRPVSIHSIAHELANSNTIYLLPSGFLGKVDEDVFRADLYSNQDIDRFFDLVRKDCVGISTPGLDDSKRFHPIEIELPHKDLTPEQKSALRQAFRYLDELTFTEAAGENPIKCYDAFDRRMPIAVLRNSINAGAANEDLQPEQRRAEDEWMELRDLEVTHEVPSDDVIRAVMDARQGLDLFPDGSFKVTELRYVDDNNTREAEAFLFDRTFTLVRYENSVFAITPRRGATDAQIESIKSVKAGADSNNYMMCLIRRGQDSREEAERVATTIGVPLFDAIHEAFDYVIDMNNLRRQANSMNEDLDASEYVPTGYSADYMEDPRVSYDLYVDGHYDHDIVDTFIEETCGDGRWVLLMSGDRTLAGAGSESFRRFNNPRYNGTFNFDEAYKRALELLGDTKEKQYCGRPYIVKIVHWGIYPVYYLNGDRTGPEYLYNVLRLPVWARDNLSVDVTVESVIQEDLEASGSTPVGYTDEYKTNPKVEYYYLDEHNNPAKDLIDLFISEACGDGRWALVSIGDEFRSGRGRTPSGGGFPLFDNPEYNGMWNFDEAYRRFLELSEDREAMTGVNFIVLAHYGVELERWLEDDSADIPGDEETLYNILRIKNTLPGYIDIHVHEDIEPQEAPVADYEKYVRKYPSIVMEPGCDDIVADFGMDHRWSLILTSHDLGLNRLRGYFNELPDDCYNGEFTFNDAFEKFLSYKPNAGDFMLTLSHMGPHPDMYRELPDKRNTTLSAYGTGLYPIFKRYLNVPSLDIGSTFLESRGESMDEDIRPTDMTIQDTLAPFPNIVLDTCDQDWLQRLDNDDSTIYILADGGMYDFWCPDPLLQPLTDDYAEFSQYLYETGILLYKYLGTVFLTFPLWKITANQKKTLSDVVSKLNGPDAADAGVNNVGIIIYDESDSANKSYCESNGWETFDSYDKAYAHRVTNDADETHVNEDLVPEAIPEPKYDEKYLVISRRSSQRDKEGLQDYYKNKICDMHTLPIWNVILYGSYDRNPDVEFFDNRDSSNILSNARFEAAYDCFLKCKETIPAGASRLGVDVNGDGHRVYPSYLVMLVTGKGMPVMWRTYSLNDTLSEDISPETHSDLNMHNVEASIFDTWTIKSDYLAGELLRIVAKRCKWSDERFNEWMRMPNVCCQIYPADIDMGRNDFKGPWELCFYDTTGPEKCYIPLPARLAKDIVNNRVNSDVESYWEGIQTVQQTVQMPEEIPVDEDLKAEPVRVPEYDASFINKTSVLSPSILKGYIEAESTDKVWRVFAISKSGHAHSITDMVDFDTAYKAFLDTDFSQFAEPVSIYTDIKYISLRYCGESAMYLLYDPCVLKKVNPKYRKIIEDIEAKALSKEEQYLGYMITNMFTAEQIDWLIKEYGDARIWEFHASSRWGMLKTNTEETFDEALNDFLSYKMEKSMLVFISVRLDFDKLPDDAKRKLVDTPVIPNIHLLPAILGARIDPTEDLDEDLEPEGIVPLDYKDYCGEGGVCTNYGSDEIIAEFNADDKWSLGLSADGFYDDIMRLGVRNELPDGYNGEFSYKEAFEKFLSFRKSDATEGFNVIELLHHGPHPETYKRWLAMAEREDRGELTDGLFTILFRYIPEDRQERVSEDLNAQPMDELDYKTNPRVKYYMSGYVNTEANGADMTIADYRYDDNWSLVGTKVGNDLYVFGKNRKFDNPEYNGTFDFDEAYKRLIEFADDEDARKGYSSIALVHKGPHPGWVSGHGDKPFESIYGILQIEFEWPYGLFDYEADQAMGTEADQALDEDLIPTDISVPKYLEEYKNDPRITTPPYKEGAVDAIIYECYDDGKWYIAGSNRRRHYMEKGRWDEIWPGQYNGVFNFDEAYRKFMQLSEDERTLHDRGYDDIYIIHVGPSPEAFLSDDDRTAYFSSNYRILQMEVGQSARKKPQSVGEDLNPEFIPEPPYDKEFINDSSLYLKPEQIEAVIQEHRDEKVWLVRAYIRDELDLISRWHTVMSGTFDEAYEAFLNTELSDDLTRVSMLFTGDDADFKIQYIEPCVLIKKFKAQNTEDVREDLDAREIASPEYDESYIPYSGFVKDVVKDWITHHQFEGCWSVSSIHSDGFTEDDIATGVVFDEAYKAFVDAPTGLNIPYIVLRYGEESERDEGSGIHDFSTITVLSKSMQDVDEDLEAAAMPIDFDPKFLNAYSILNEDELVEIILSRCDTPSWYTVAYDSFGQRDSRKSDVTFKEAYKDFCDCKIGDKTSFGTDIVVVRMFYEGGGYGPICPCVLVKRDDDLGDVNEDLDPEAVEPISWKERMQGLKSPWSMDVADEIIQTFGASKVWSVFAPNKGLDGMVGGDMNFDEAFEVFEETYRELVNTSWPRSWKEIQLAYHGEYPPDYVAGRNTGDILNWVILRKNNPYVSARESLLPEDLEFGEASTDTWTDNYIETQYLTVDEMNKLIREQGKIPAWGFFAHTTGSGTDVCNADLTFEEAYYQFITFQQDDGDAGTRWDLSLFVDLNKLPDDVDCAADMPTDDFMLVMYASLQGGEDSLPEDLEPEAMPIPKVLTSWREMLPDTGDCPTSFVWDDEATDGLILDYGEDRRWSVWSNSDVLDAVYNVSFEEAFKVFIEKSETLAVTELCFHGQSPGNYLEPDYDPDDPSRYSNADWVVMRRSRRVGKITEDLEPEALPVPKVLTSWKEMLPKDDDYVTQIRWGDDVTDNLILECGEEECWSLWDSDGVIDDKFDVSFEEAFKTFLEKCETANTSLDICFHGKSPLKLFTSTGEMGGDYDWMVISRRQMGGQDYPPPRPL